MKFLPFRAIFHCSFACLSFTLVLPRFVFLYIFGFRRVWTFAWHSIVDKYCAFHVVFRSMRYDGNAQQKILCLISKAQYVFAARPSNIHCNIKASKWGRTGRCASVIKRIIEHSSFDENILRKTWSIALIPPIVILRMVWICAHWFIFRCVSQPDPAEMTS